MLRRHWRAFVLAVALLLCPYRAATQGVSNVDVSGLCFEHVGLQGKPMPEFCIDWRANSGSDPSSSTLPILQVSEATFDEVLDRCRTGSTNGDSAQVGVYRWTRVNGERDGGVVGPRTMRWIADQIREDAIRRGEPVPDVIDRLGRRLQM